MNEARWFLAHKRLDEDTDINHWCDLLVKKLNQPNWKAEVVAGRDDYNDRAKSLGGWKAWGRNVSRAKTFDGSILFHGIIVPASALDYSPTVGKSTAQLVQGFLDQQKHAYVWCSFTGDFRQIKAVRECGEDDFKKWARLDLRIDKDDYRNNPMSDEEVKELGLDDDPERKATQALEGFEAAGFDTSQVIGSNSIYDPYGRDHEEKFGSR